MEKGGPHACLRQKRMLKRKDAPEGEETPAAVRPKVDAGSAIVPPEEDAVIEELVRQREEKRANKCARD